ncbi:S49 family peptidase [Chloroflexota bacterium]
MKWLDRVGIVAVRVLRSLILWLVVGAAVGVLLFVGVVGRPAVGLIRIPLAISLPETTKDIVRMMAYARETREIKAVVLEIDSPGGSAVLVEEIYLALNDLRQVKPVVTSIDRMALSGGFYIGVASDFIYAKPTSMVGNIGVWMTLPEEEAVTEGLLPTGPYKAGGFSKQDAVKMLDMVKEGFVQVVMKERGEQLKLGKEEVSQGRIYLGMEGVQSGLVDKIGTTEDAAAQAARLARVANYSVVDIAERLDISYSRPLFSFESETPPIEESRGPAINPAPRFYYLYLDSVQGIK